MKVDVHVATTERPDDYGRPQAATEATCSRCGNETWAWGSSAASTTRCLAELRGTCPKAEDNYYAES